MDGGCLELGIGMRVCTVSGWGISGDIKDSKTN